jgi:hypothetical protein
MERGEREESERERESALAWDITHRVTTHNLEAKPRRREKFDVAAVWGKKYIKKSKPAAAGGQNIVWTALLSKFFIHP